MLPLKLARSLLLHETFSLTHNPGETVDGDGNGNEDGETSIRQILSSYKQSKTRSRSDDKSNNTRNSKTPLLYFVPTRELISDTYRLATIARDLGMDLYPTPSLSHIIFSFPPRESGSPSTASSSSHPSTWSSSAASLSSSLSWSLPNDAVMLSFPSLSASSLSHLRSFVSLSNSLFKLVFSAAVETPSSSSSSGSISNWDCCSVSLFSRITSKRIGSMESFSQALTSNGWTIYKGLGVVERLAGLSGLFEDGVESALDSFARGFRAAVVLRLIMCFSCRRRSLFSTVVSRVTALSTRWFDEATSSSRILPAGFATASGDHVVTSFLDLFEEFVDHQIRSQVFI